MIAAHSFADKKTALFGLGGSGVVTAHALLAGGADVMAWDDNPDRVAHAAGEKIPVKDLHEIDWTDFDVLVLAPGVPLTHPKPHWTAQLANANHVPIIGDVEIFVQERKRAAPDCPFIAITGTNGKSTTTALIAHILISSGKNVQMGGNIGTAILSLEPPSDDVIYVVECSSYQIDLAPSINPTAGILLNLSPDHLDRHGTMTHYASVKERLVKQSQTAIVSFDDQWCTAIFDHLKDPYDDGPKSIIPISVHTPLPVGIYFDKGSLLRSVDNDVTDHFDLDGIATLRGAHNAQNAAAAIAACQAVGISSSDIADAIRTFTGLKHRMQPVARSGPILFVNDSKATNAEAVAPALKSFDRIFWIAGGLAKDQGIEPLLPLLDQVKKIFLIGEAAPIFAAQLGQDVEFEITETLDRAVVQAYRAAVNEDDGRLATILFSPACASFDQFQNFEVRGDYFVDQVSRLSNVDMLIPSELRR